MFESLTMNCWLWFGIAATLIILEILISTSFFLLWLGLSAFVTGIVVWLAPELSWYAPIFLFALGAIFSMALWKHYLKKHTLTFNKSDQPLLNRRAEQYVGRTFTLSEPIQNGRGKIKVDDSTWRVEGPDLPVGTQVVVIGVDSVTLKVKPLSTFSNSTGN
jgi:membrane protein implicated in regulation of membrane protease activity